MTLSSGRIFFRQIDRVKKLPAEALKTTARELESTTPALREHQLSRKLEVKIVIKSFAKLHVIEIRVDA